MNQELSVTRARAVYDCINGKMSTLFPKVKVKSSPDTDSIGKGWDECIPYKKNTPNKNCRKVTVTIQTTPCS